MGNSVADLVANMSVAVSSLESFGVGIILTDGPSIGVRSHHGLLSLLWWAYVEHSARYRHHWDIYHTPNVRALPAAFLDNPRYHGNWSVSLPPRYAHLCPLEQLLPSAQLGHHAHRCLFVTDDC